jgi:hypothetical protein
MRQHYLFSAPSPIRLFVTALYLFAFFLVGFSFLSQAQPYTHEALFSDSSSSGLAIVPASCPSDPHYAGECSQPCYFNGLEVPHGSSVTAYQTPNVPYGSSCVSESRSCDNGALSGSYAYASCSVNAPSNCTLDGTTVTHGTWATAYQSATVPFGSSCTSQGRYCDNGSLSGTYAYASCTVDSPTTCPLDGTIIPHGEARTCFSTRTAPSGTLCSTYSQNRSCYNGTLSGDSAYQYASCSCTPSYSCSGNSIQYTNASCITSTIATCVAPAFCSPGFSTCQYPPPEVVPEYGKSGHVFSAPSFVIKDSTAQLFWNVTNVTSCTVSGSNGQSWSGANAGCAGVTCDAGSSGKTTLPITAMTTYTLSCTGADSSIFSEQAIIRLAPEFGDE